MNVANLIALAAERVFADAPERLGVRCSPVTLNAGEILDVVRAVRESLGSSVFIVGSAPGVETVDLDERAFVAPDHRAAERATAWRNRVDVGAGEHLVYVSVEEHGKASGLKDCLVALRESDLLDTFFQWADGTKNGLPTGFADALRSSGIAAQARLSAMCTLADAAVRGSKKKGSASWDEIGRNLPLIGLAADTKLGKADAVDRLAANAALVRAISTGEGRRRSEGGPLGAVETRLAAALSQSAADDRAKSLAAIDLGALKTAVFAKKKPEPRRPRSEGVFAQSAAQPQAKQATKRETPRRDAGTHDETTNEQLDRDLIVVAAAAAASPLGVALGVAGVSEEQPAVAPRSKPIRLHGAVLSSGVSALLDRLLQSDHGTLHAVARSDPRVLLRTASKTAVLTEPDLPQLSSNLPDLLAAWRAARRAVIGLASARGGAQRPADLLTRGIGSLLEDAEFVSAKERLVDATGALYAAADRLDEPTMLEALALDTCAVGAGGRVSLRLLGPLHMLSLGQAVTGMNAAVIARTISDSAARRLVTRAALVAPACPATFPDASGELALSAGHSGLVVYERVPELVPARAMQSAARSIALRFAALSPHALLGLRVALVGEGDLGPALDGLAEALDEEPLLRRVEALCVRPPETSDRGPAARAIESGRLTLGPLADDGETTAHIAIVIVGHGDALDDEPGLPAASFAPVNVGARTTFDLRARGLRVRTSVKGVRELESLEQTLARAKGRLPQGAFASDVVARSLRSEVERAASIAAATWTAVIGPEIGRRPPMNLHLLAHEEIAPSITCAVVARDLRPATRALQSGLRSLDLREERPKALQMLAVRLAELGRSAIVALHRPPEHLVAVGLLAAELRKELGEGAIVAPLTGAVLEALTGVRDSEQTGSMFLGVAATPTGIRALVGFGTLDRNLEIDTTKSQFGGAAAKALASVVDALDLASTDAGAGGTAAREILSWSLWAAIVKDETVSAELRARLSAWSDPLPVHSEVLMLVRPEVAGKERSAKIGRAPATLKILGVDQINRLLLAR